jgi:cell division protein FtsB
VQTQRKSVLASLQVAGLAAVMTLVSLYFVYHMFEGDRGLLVLVQQQALLEDKLSEVAMLEAKVAGIRSKVQGLADRSLDLDLLEEQVRKVLHYSHPHEVIVLQ